MKEWEGAERVFAPVWRDQDFSPTALAQRFKQYSDESDVGEAPGSPPPAASMPTDRC